MDIEQAKQEIKQTVRAYLAKEEDGSYRIPAVHQRPILLMGPPGVGKTAILEQAADECGIALVSYTITHHTRQSAIGLPYLEKRSFGGREYTVTEYTMSEIIAAVYEKMEETGCREGILFLDEINCVSETLAPTMLQFLQRKTFGSHAVPEGWIIVAAGNPPAYNRSVRDFDVVTLDRLKRIDVTEDLNVWKKYAYRHNVHPAILSYLELRRENFYVIETTADGMQFVTARGWEDLSVYLAVCESLGLPLTEAVVGEYLQHPRVARDFAAYYDLFCKYRTAYQIDDLLAGKITEGAVQKIREAPFDERLSVIGLLLGRLNGDFAETWREELRLQQVFERVKTIRQSESDQPLRDRLAQAAEILRGSVEQRRKAAGPDRREAKALEAAADDLTALSRCAAEAGENAWLSISAQLGERSDRYEAHCAQTSAALENAFAFLEGAFGRSQELVVFVTELSTDFYAVHFIGENGSEAYARCSRELMLNRQRGEVLGQIDSMQGLTRGM